jgi:hypothetical protein
MKQSLRCVGGPHDGGWAEVDYPLENMVMLTRAAEPSVIEGAGPFPSVANLAAMAKVLIVRSIYSVRLLPDNSLTLEFDESATAKYANAGLG